MNTNNTLTHHGIKGMKWGVRRFQNKDGSLTAAGKRRMANEYDYKQTDRYKNATRGEKTHMTNLHNNAKDMFGKKAANRIDYKTYEENKNRDRLTRHELGKQLLIGTAVTLAATVGMEYVNNKFNLSKRYVDLNNNMVDAVAVSKGLNEVKGGFTLGVGAVSRGKKVVEHMMRR